MYDTWVLSLGQEDPFKKEMATATVFLPGKSYGQSLAGYSPWGRKESDTTEVTERSANTNNLIFEKFNLVSKAACLWL